MIVTDVRSTLVPGENSNRYRHSKQPKRRHILAGELTLNLGKVDVDTRNCTVFSTSGNGSIGNFYETMQQRQDRLDAARRQQQNQRLVKERSRSRSRSSSRSPKSGSSSERVSRENTRAATKIQRAYRAHRAIQILNKLERSILDAFNPSRDSRSVLSYLRARSAEFAALRAFMSATPHVSDNERVADVICRVSETLKRSIACAEWGERDRKIEATIVHHSDSVTSPSPSRRKEAVHHANTANTWRVPAMTNSVGGANTSDWSSGTQLPFSLKVSSNTLSPLHHALETKYPESRVHYPHSSQISQQCTDQHKLWISRVLSASPTHRSRRHLTVSKVPALLTIPEGSELVFP